MACWVSVARTQLCFRSLDRETSPPFWPSGRAFHAKTGTIQDKARTWWKSCLRQYVNEWVWPSACKTSFLKTGVGLIWVKGRIMLTPASGYGTGQPTQSPALSSLQLVFRGACCTHRIVAIVFFPLSWCGRIWSRM